MAGAQKAWAKFKKNYPQVANEKGFLEIGAQLLQYDTAQDQMWNSVNAFIDQINALSESTVELDKNFTKLSVVIRKMNNGDKIVDDLNNTVRSLCGQPKSTMKRKISEITKAGGMLSDFV